MLIGDHPFVDKIHFSKPQFWIDSLILPQQKIKRFDIVAFKAPPKLKTKNFNKIWYVKRVIGLPGEIIQIKNKIVYVNGKKLKEKFTKFKLHIDFLNNFPTSDNSIYMKKFPEVFSKNFIDIQSGKAFLIPNNYFFCMGDNRDLSSDSRIWGPVPREFIIGKPWRILWSFSNKQNQIHKKTFFTTVKSLLLLLPDFFIHTRWNRILKKY